MCYIADIHRFVFCMYACKVGCTIQYIQQASKTSLRHFKDHIYN